MCRCHRRQLLNSITKVLKGTGVAPTKGKAFGHIHLLNKCSMENMIQRKKTIENSYEV